MRRCTDRETMKMAGKGNIWAKKSGKLAFSAFDLHYLCKWCKN